MRPATHAPEDVHRHPQALLLIDLISDWDFPDAPALIGPAERIAAPIESLATRCRHAGVPVIYANDNRGRWRSDWREQVEEARHAAARNAVGRRGARLTARIEPQASDYFVLKPAHSAFQDTPLHRLLVDLGTRELLLAGLTADLCVLATAWDAKSRGIEPVVVADAVAAPTVARTRRVLRLFEDGMRLRVLPSAALPAAGVAGDGGCATMPASRPPPEPPCPPCPTTTSSATRPTTPR